MNLMGKCSFISWVNRFVPGPPTSIRLFFSSFSAFTSTSSFTANSLGILANCPMKRARCAA